MHEMSICESIRDIIEARAREDGFARVRRVTLEVGPLSGVEVEALRFGFDVVMHDSVAAGAALDIVEPPARAWCMPCGREVDIEHRYDPCPSCGGHLLRVTGGEQLRIRELEVN